jgi:hypothetical protein
MKVRKAPILLLCVFLFLTVLPYLSFPQVKAQSIYEATFYPSSISGYIRRNSTFYPVNASSTENKYEADTYPTVAQYLTGSMYYVCRSFYSFDTSSLPDTASILQTEFYVSVYLSQVDSTNFNVVLYSGKDQYTNTSNWAWGDCSTLEGVIFGTNGLILNRMYYRSLQISSVSLTGLTQFRLINNNEGSAPSDAQTVILTAWNSSSYTPYLHVKYYLSTGTTPQKQVNLLALNQALGDALGVSPFIGGLILSFAICFSIVLAFAVVQAPFLAYVGLFMGVLPIFVVLGWLPIFVLFLEIFGIAISFANWVSKHEGGS